VADVDPGECSAAEQAAAMDVIKASAVSSVRDVVVLCGIFMGSLSP
jgi:hypothetical protein